MSFAQVLERLRDAAQEWPKDDTCVVPRGDRRIIERDDLREILKHFDRLDREFRRIADEEAKRRQSVKDHHDLLITLETRSEICKRLFDTLPKAGEYTYSERYGTHVYMLTIKRQRARKEARHGG